MLQSGFSHSATATCSEITSGGLHSTLRGPHLNVKVYLFFTVHPACPLYLANTFSIKEWSNKSTNQDTLLLSLL